MKVSVVVPVFEADQWIDQCLESIHEQTYEDIDLIVIDDSEGSGAAVSRNRGLDLAQGELVAFCDADDYLEPKAIQTMVSAMHDHDMVCGSFRKFGDFEAVVKHESETMGMKGVAHYAMGNLRNPRENQMLSGCWAKLYRKSLIGKFPELTTAEDMAFNYDYLTRCKSVRFISEIVYNNRKHSGSLSTTFDEENKPGLFGFLEGLDYVGEFLSKHYSEEKIRRATDNSKVYHSILYFQRICQQTGLPMREAMRMLYP